MIKLFCGNTLETIKSRWLSVTYFNVHLFKSKASCMITRAFELNTQLNPTLWNYYSQHKLTRQTECVTRATHYTQTTQWLRLIAPLSEHSWHALCYTLHTINQDQRSNRCTLRRTELSLRTGIIWPCGGSGHVSPSMGRYKHFRSLKFWMGSLIFRLETHEMSFNVRNLITIRHVSYEFFTFRTVGG